MSYYHYTKGYHLAKIVNDGLITTSKNCLDKKEKPAAWLTKSPIWEVACNSGLITNSQDLKVGQIYTSDEVDTVTASNEYMKKEIGMCRILISDWLPVISWAKFKHVSGISLRFFNALDKYSRKMGCPVEQWFCTFSGIPQKYWEGIEMFVDDQWVRWDEELPIQEFVDLCLSCNGKQIEKKLLINGFSKEHTQKQIDFIFKYYDEILEVWEANKDKKGYVEIYIHSDYQPYKSGFNFIEKRIKKTSFKPFREVETENHALVHFLWEATYTQYRMALPYEKVEGLAKAS